MLTTGLARAAAAQTGAGGATGTSALTASDLLIVAQQTPGAALANFDLQRFFNVSNCQCNTPVYLYFTFTQSGFQKRLSVGEGNIDFWVGRDCNNISLRNCRQLGSTISLTTFANKSGVVVATDAQTLSQNFGQPGVSTGTSVTDGGLVTSDGGPSGTDACSANLAFGQTIWALITFSGGPIDEVSATLPLTIDLAPPPPPTGLTLGSGNEAVIANWTGIDSSVNIDLLGYQVLCDRAGELQVFKNGTFSSGFKTCGNAPLPSGLDANIYALDPKYLCSPLLTTLTSSYRIKILENEINYGVGVVAIDTHYNASVPQVLYQKPAKTLSFYDVYRNGDSANTAPGQSPDPGRASGGYCAVAGDTGGASGVAGLAGVVAAFGLGMRRRRPRSRRP